MNLVRFIVLAGLTLDGVVLADSVVTLGGQKLEGRIVLAEGALKVGSTTVALKEVRRAKFDAELKDTTLEPKDELSKLTSGLWALRRPGVLCWNGSFIARPVAGMDDTKVTFQDAPKGLFVSKVNTAAVIFGQVSYAQAMMLQDRRAGVLLASGDFVDGMPRSITNGTVVMDSVLFGRKSFVMGTEAMAVLLRTPSVTAGDFTIRMRNGSELLVKAPVFKDGVIVLKEGVFKEFQVKHADLIEIRRGDAADILSQAWTKVKNSGPAERTQLMTNVANVGQAIQLHNLVKQKAEDLREATMMLEKANAERAAVLALRTKVQQKGTQARLTWRQHTQAYTRAKSDAQRLKLQADVSKRNVDRLKRAVDSARREIENQDRKLKDFNMKMARAKDNEKLLRKYRGQHAEAERSLDRARKALSRAEQKLKTGRRDYEARIAKTKPMFEKEEAARQRAEEAKRANTAAQKETGKARSAYIKALRKPVEARRRVADLKREHDDVLAKLEQLKPNIPNIGVPEPR